MTLATRRTASPIVSDPLLAVAKEAVGAAIAAGPPRLAAGPWSRAATRSLRASPWVLAAIAVAVGLHVGDPADLLRSDPELARLLRGMAALKALAVVAALAVVTWRLGRAIVPRFATGYLVGTTTIAGATAAIWQLSSIAPAALLFHVGALSLMVLAWRDDGVRFRSGVARRRAVRRDR